MSHKSFLGLVVFLAMAMSVVAQVPQSMTSQAVLRSSNGSLVANRQVSVRVSILHGSAEGAAVYVEKHSPTTNANGLYTINVGEGVVEQGSFSAINWGNGPYFIKSEADPTGGDFYSLETIQQLQSVPYALYAVQAGTAVNAVTAHRSDTAVISLSNSEQQRITLSGDTIFLVDGDFVSHVVLPSAQIGPNIINNLLNTIRNDIHDSLNVVRGETHQPDGCYATCGAIDSLRRERDSITRHYDSLIHELSNDTTPFCPTTRASVSETACDQFVWTDGDGLTYTSTGTAVHIIANACGSDSIITLHLTINHGSHNAETQVIQTGQIYRWHDIDYNTEGTYTHEYNDAHGCASADTLHLVVTAVPCSPTMGIDHQTACETYTWIDGQTYTESTTTPTHVITAGNYCGADSTVTLALAINHGTNLSETHYIQAGTSYTWHGTEYSTEGSFIYQYTNAAGCASFDTLHIIFTTDPCPPTMGIDHQTACDTYTWINGQTYTESTTTPTHVITAGNYCGADSTVTLALTIKHGTFASETQTATAAYTWHGTEYPATGVYTYSYTNNDGCPSVDTLHLTVTAAPVEGDIEGSGSGLFTADANGTQVRFSLGNLQYQGSTSTWRFAEHQYDIIGAFAGNTTSLTNRPSQPDWIDLFGWGTSGWDSEANKYLPYETSTTASDYMPGNNVDNDLTGNYANADWGVNNPISNGGNQAGLWRTLTADEWVYIFNTRSASTVAGTANARFVAAKVNSISGIILFPDEYTHPSGVTAPTGINVRTTTFAANTYSATAWESMEAAGAIFLPAAGHRNGTSVTTASTPYGTTIYGYYWSSTHTGVNTNNKQAAKYLLFYYNSNNAVILPTSNSASDYSTPRSEGLSVRLVHNSNGSTTCAPTSGTDVHSAVGSYTWIDGITYTESNTTATYVITGGNHCGADSTVTLNLTITAAPAGDGSLPGGFSIAAGTQVQFSMGNLQYLAAAADGYAAGTWRFAEHQYDRVGNATTGNVYMNDNTKCDNIRLSSTYAGWIDLFGYGCTGWNSGLSGKTSYEPWSKSESYSTYFSQDPVGTYANADWGQYCSIINGGNQAGLWRLPTKPELQYLFNSRTNAANLWSFGTVAGVPGLIILPDNWSLPTGMTFTPSISNTFTNSSNTYTAEQWSTMESAGAVFLPETGSRGKMTSINGSEYKVMFTTTRAAYYWTATHQAFAGNYSSALNFNSSDGLKPDGAYGLEGGIAVRLIRSYQAPATTCEPSYGTDVQSAEGSYTWIDGITYTASTTTAQYTITGGNHCGADSIVTLNLTITAAAEPVGGSLSGTPLSGAFSVGEDRQVTFSPGNLQYQASTGSWRFADHQYDFVGGYANTVVYGQHGNVYENGQQCSNNSPTSTYSGYIDLFAWGTSGWNSGATLYQPYSISNSNADYYVGGSTENSLTGNYANADWGVYNSDGAWRTLTDEEWGYLLETRTDAAKKKSLAMVNGIRGLVLLPDEWTLPATCSFADNYRWGGRTSDYNSGYSTNTYTLDQWNDMEAAGAVFLPWTGYRAYDGDFYTIGRCYEGFYWSSTAAASDKANIISFYIDNSGDGYGVIKRLSNNRYSAYSVRLVHDGGSTASCLPSSSVDVQSAVGSYTWIDGITYTESNTTATYVITGGNHCGADSTITLNLTITQPATPEETVEGALSGAFTVDANGTQIQFSKGNLQYLGSTSTFRFSDNQYDYCGGYAQNDNNTYGNVTGGSNTTYTTTYSRQNSAVLIDLIPYGTSNWDGGDFDYYQPYLVANAMEYCTHSLTGDYANADWGVYNAIDGGGNQAGLWRVPTYDEWNYLLNERPNAATHKSLATIKKSLYEEYPGMIILPDDFQLPDGCEFSADYNTSHYAGYSTNEYDLNQWQLMQDAGAVFLPAGGFRALTSYYFPTYNYIGIYWSATTYNDDYAYYVAFADAGSSSSSRAWISVNHSDSDAMIGYDYGNKTNGHQIRLVRNIAQ